MGSSSGPQQWTPPTFAPTSIIFQAQNAATFARESGDLSVKAANLAASQYDSAAAAVLNAGQFNVDVVNINENRSLQNISDSIPQINGTQIAQQAGAGFGVNSKSFSAISADTLTGLTKMVTQTQASFEVQRQSAWFNAQSQAAADRNQGIIARYAGQLDQYKATQTAAIGMSNAQREEEQVQWQMQQDAAKAMGFNVSASGGGRSGTNFGVSSFDPTGVGALPSTNFT